VAGIVKKKHQRSADYAVAFGSDAIVIGGDYEVFIGILLNINRAELRKSAAIARGVTEIFRKTPSDGILAAITNNAAEFMLDKVAAELEAKSQQPNVVQ
jgi:hypothetical protein